MNETQLCKPKKRVFFAEKNAIHRIPSLEDLECECVLRDLWYTRYVGYLAAIGFLRNYPGSYRRDFYIFKMAATEELQVFMQRYGFDTHALAVLYLYQPDSITGMRSEAINTNAWVIFCILHLNLRGYFHVVSIIDGFAFIWYDEG